MCAPTTPHCVIVPFITNISLFSITLRRPSKSCARLPVRGAHLESRRRLPSAAPVCHVNISLPSLKTTCRSQVSSLDSDSQSTRRIHSMFRPPTVVVHGAQCRDGTHLPRGFRGGLGNRTHVVVDDARTTDSKQLIYDARCVAGFRCQLGDAHHRRPRGILSSLAPFSTSLHTEWPQFQHVSSTIEYQGPLPKTCPCKHSHKPMKCERGMSFVTTKPWSVPAAQCMGVVRTQQPFPFRVLLLQDVRQ